MKLDRNRKENNGLGKYALLLLRRLEDFQSGAFATLPKAIQQAFETLEKTGILDWGREGTESEFFLIRLKDKYAAAALHAYADAAQADDPEWAAEVRAMAERSGPAHPNCKQPD